MTGTNKTVLSIGTIQDLLWLREAVLEHAGFKVFSVTDETNAKAKIYPDGCDVLLLCYSIHDGVRARITKLFRERAPAVGSLQLRISIYSVHHRMQTASFTGLKGPKRSLRLYEAPRSHPTPVPPELFRFWNEQ